MSIKALIVTMQPDSQQNIKWNKINFLQISKLILGFLPHFSVATRVGLWVVQTAAATSTKYSSWSKIGGSKSVTFRSASVVKVWIDFIWYCKHIICMKRPRNQIDQPELHWWYFTLVSIVQTIYQKHSKQMGLRNCGSCAVIFHFGTLRKLHCVQCS